MIKNLLLKLIEYQKLNLMIFGKNSLNMQKGIKNHILLMNKIIINISSLCLGIKV